MDVFALQQIINRISLLKFRYLGSLPSDYVPSLDNDTFAIINTQRSNMQGEHWIMNAKFRQELFFADSFGCKGYIFLNNDNQHCKQMMPAPLQSQPNECGFYTIYAVFHIFKHRREEIRGFQDVNVLSFIIILCNFSTFLCKNVQFTLCYCPIFYILINFFKKLQSFYLALIHIIISRRKIYPHA